MSLAPLTVAAALGGRLRRARHWWGLGMVTGVVFFGGTLYWLAPVMTEHGGLSMPVASGLTIGLAIYLAVFIGAFSALVGFTSRRWSVMTAVWLSPVFWVATEWTRAWLGAAFPWVLLGSSQARTVPVVQLASVTGVYGLSALVALISASAAALALSRRREHLRGVAAAWIVLAGVAAWGAWRVERGTLLAAGPAVRVGLLQGNIAQHAKWDPTFRDAILDRYLDLSRQAIGAGAQLVLWPEAAAPFYFEEEPARAEPVRRLAAQTHVPLLIGTDLFERGSEARPDRYFNGAVLVGPDGRTVASYRKMRLVPFGEYVPFKPALFFVGPLVQAVSDFSAGDELTIFAAETARFSVAICYEAIYAGLARAAVRRGAGLLATITNDAWFGRSSAAFQHFEQAGLRAVEQGRYLVRAANTGISGAVDPYGRVLAASRLFDTTVLTVTVGVLNGRTIYSRVGDVVAWFAIVVAGGVLGWGRWRHARLPGRQSGHRPPGG